MWIFFALFPVLCLAAPAAQPQSRKVSSVDYNQDVLSGVELLRLFSKASESIAHKHYNKKLPIDAQLSQQLEKELSKNTLHSISATNRVSPPQKPSHPGTNSVSNASDTQTSIFDTFVQSFATTKTTERSSSAFTTTGTTPGVTTRPTVEATVTPRFWSEDEAFRGRVIGSDNYLLETYRNGGVKPRQKISVSQSVSVNSDTSAHRRPKDLKNPDHPITTTLRSAENTTPTWSQPSINWGSPAKVWGEPAIQWGEPSKVWGQQEKVWSEPAKVWSEPARNWGEPAKNWGEAPTEAPVDTPVKSYVVQGRVSTVVHLEQLSPQGFILGEYGLFQNGNNENIQGVQYIADPSADPKVVWAALRTFLSLPSKERDKKI